MMASRTSSILVKSRKRTFTPNEQGSNEQGVGVAEEMLRGNDVLALCCQGHESVAHLPPFLVEGCGVRQHRSGCHSALQVGHRQDSPRGSNPGTLILLVNASAMTAALSNS